VFYDVQEGRWDTEGMLKAGDYFYGKRKESHQLGTVAPSRWRWLLKSKEDTHHQVSIKSQQN
jgi:hypothetical protein